MKHATRNSNRRSPYWLEPVGHPSQWFAKTALLFTCLLSFGLPAIAADYNSNGIEDATEIAAGTSADCDTNGLPDECEGVLFVDDSATNGLNDGSSWQDAFVYLQDALATAESDCTISQIWVAAGTYKPDQGGGRSAGDPSTSFELQNNLAVYGGFAGSESSLDQRDHESNLTILSGDMSGNDQPVPCSQDAPDCDLFGGMCYEGACIASDNMGDNGGPVVVGSDTDSTAVIDGLMVTAGRSYIGGGMYNNAGDPTISNCNFVGNVSLDILFGGRGGGMNNYQSNPSISDCQFVSNLADSEGGAVYNRESNPVMDHCEFVANLSSLRGGAILNFDSLSTVTNSEFKLNRSEFGGAMFNDMDTVLTGCTFVGNSAASDLGGSGGALFNYLCDPAIEKCAFYGNLTDAGGGAIENRGSSPSVSNSIFSGNQANYGGGILNQPGGLTGGTPSRPTIANCTFGGNRAKSSGGSIYSITNSYPFVSNSVFWKNTPDQSNSIFGAFEYCISQGHLLGSGEGVIYADPLFVDSNGPDNIVGTEDDDLRIQAGSPAIDAGNNVIVPVGITTDHSGDPRFSDDINTVDTGVGPTPIVDIGAFEFQAGTVLYVDADATGGANDGTSWGDAFVNLQDALLDATSNAIVNQIWVAAGTYKPDQGTAQTPGDRGATFQLQSGLAIYGGFDGNETAFEQRDIDANGTILSGDLLGDDLPNFGNYSENALHVLTGSGTNENALINGFRITAGRANKSPFSGGGMLNEAGHPTVDHCVFEHNLAGIGIFSDCCGGGGGIANIGSAPVIRNCRFNGNTAVSGGGIYNLDQSEPTIENCIFEKNANFLNPAASPYGGAGIQNEDSDPVVLSCSFVRNNGGEAGGILNTLGSNPTIWLCNFNSNGRSGVVNIDASDAIIDSCVFTNNDWIGIDNRFSQPTIANCTFLGNAFTGMVNAFSNTSVTNCVFNGNGTGSINAGGMYNLESAPLVTNCTFSGNAVSIEQSVGGGIHNIENSCPQVSNCIFWGNVPGQIEAAGNSPVVNHSVVQGGWIGAGGIGIIDADPVFIDSNGADDILGTEDDDLRILPNSPAIDAGDNSAVPVGVTVDLDGHPRFVDDPTVADTGQGTAPVVDIGAYEYVLGDCDADGDADTADHVILDGCLTNPGDALGSGCACLDLDSDGDVDLRDFGYFQMAFIP